MQSFYPAAFHAKRSLVAYATAFLKAGRAADLLHLGPLDIVSAWTPHNFFKRVGPGFPTIRRSPSGLPAPLVVWQGSHEIIRRVLRDCLRGVPPNRWTNEDLTKAYGKARQECFETCRRLTLHACPGEAYLIHRLALHGVAPWAAEAKGERMIAYFRPNPFPGAAPTWWLTRP